MKLQPGVRSALHAVALLTGFALLGWLAIGACVLLLLRVF